MGPYCGFCDQRCFLPRVLADGQSVILATCASGMAHDQSLLGGQDHTNTHNPASPTVPCQPACRQCVPDLVDAGQLEEGRPMTEIVNGHGRRLVVETDSSGMSVLVVTVPGFGPVRLPLSDDERDALAAALTPLPEQCEECETTGYNCPLHRDWASADTAG